MNNDKTKRVIDYFAVVGLNDKNYEPYKDDLIQTSINEPIIDIQIINKTLLQPVPSGYECISSTPGGLNANLNYGSVKFPDLYVCYKRGRNQPPITDIGLLFVFKVEIHFYN
jgi:hypothetical protein